MLTLALDACLAACSVAVVEDGRPRASLSEPMTRGHQERLAAMTREAMSAAGVAFGDLRRIGVTVGPGSFTGLRVGLAFAKGLALALEIPCIGVGSLEALAAGVQADGALFAVIDAGRDHIYVQQFDGGRPVSAPDILPIDTVMARLVDACALGRVTVTGPGTVRLALGTPAVIVKGTNVPDPSTIGRLAALAAPTPPRPLYLRPPDARPKAA